MRLRWASRASTESVKPSARACLAVTNPSLSSAKAMSSSKRERGNAPPLGLLGSPVNIFPHWNYIDKRRVIRGTAHTPFPLDEPSAPPVCPQCVFLVLHKEFVMLNRNFHLPTMPNFRGQRSRRPTEVQFQALRFWLS